MIDQPTLFILGAGASKPYGFPTGRELKTQIIRSFSDDFKELLSVPPTLKSFEKERELREAKSFVEHFSKSPVYSIDQYLAINPMYQPYGKMAIAYYIRKKEMESKFLEDMPSFFMKKIGTV